MKSEIPREILLVEDEMPDVDALKIALEGAAFDSNLNHAKNGLEALQFLRKVGKYADAKTPHLVLLDLNLPKMNGRDVLKEIKTDLNLKTIPVVVMTSSDSESDVRKSYELHANLYIKKPIGIDKLSHIIRLLGELYFSAASLPSR
jgi:two-component system, chemotaxis family, response regulator Rcp1